MWVTLATKTIKGLGLGCMFPLEYVVGGVISVSGGIGQQSGVQGQGAIINLSVISDSRV